MGQRKKDRQWPKPGTVRHVWVQSPEHHMPPDPGLLIAWQKPGSTWYAWVITVVDRPGNSAAVLQRWYHQRDVVAAPTQPQSPDRSRWHLGWMEDQQELQTRRQRTWNG